jgi:nucleotide-binding universal stress UspA family protein
MHVFVPIDGTPASFHALDFGIELAANFDADLDVVHLTDRETEGTETIRRRAEQRLREGGFDSSFELITYADLEGPGVSNKVGNHLVELIEEREYDHVVLGRHEEGILESLLIGSASKPVLQQIDVPVTLMS